MQSPGLGSLPDVSAGPSSLSECLGFQFQVRVVRVWPPCRTLLGWLRAAHLLPLGGRSFFAFRDKLQRTAKYSET